MRNHLLRIAFLLRTAKNIYNLDELDHFIGECERLTTDPNIKKWIKANLKNYFKNDYKDVVDVKFAKPGDPEWVEKAADKGDLVKLVLNKKVREQVIQWIEYIETNYADTSKIVNIAPQDLIAKHAETEPKKGLNTVYRDKYFRDIKWVELDTQKALAYESDIMGHCIGRSQHMPQYWGRIQDGSGHYYSLRDKTNTPRCTIEFLNGRVEQIKGPNNGAVVTQYAPAVWNFLQKYLKVKPQTNVKDFGNVANSSISYIEELKSYAIPAYVSEVETSWQPPPNTTTLASNLTVHGDLDLGECANMTSLPAKLRVGGTLLLPPGVKTIPEGIIVRGAIKTAEGYTVRGGKVVSESHNAETLIKLLGEGSFQSKLTKKDFTAILADVKDDLTKQLTDPKQIAKFIQLVDKEYDILPDFKWTPEVIAQFPVSFIEKHADAATEDEDLVSFEEVFTPKFLTQASPKFLQDHYHLDVVEEYIAKTPAKIKLFSDSFILSQARGGDKLMNKYIWDNLKPFDLFPSNNLMSLKSVLDNATSSGISKNQVLKQLLKSKDLEDLEFFNGLGGCPQVVKEAYAIKSQGKAA